MAAGGDRTLSPRETYLRLLAEADTIKPKRQVNREEQDFQIALMEVLDVALRPSFHIHHVPNGGGRSKAEAGILKAMGVRSGIADLCLVGEGGLVYFLELKRRHGKARKDQVTFQRWCAAYNVPYEIAETLSEALEHLRSWGALKHGLRVSA